jgi:hypothetical protein
MIPLVTGISRWTSQNRTHLVHIADAGNKPICGKTYFSTDFYYGDAREITCQKCIKKCNSPKKIPLMICQECNKIITESEHNYGTPDCPVCLFCYVEFPDENNLI